METSYYIYIYRKSTYYKKVFFRQTHREGNPPLNPPGRCAPPSWTEKKQKTFPGIRDAFFLDYWFLVSSVLPECREPMGHRGIRQSVRLRQKSRFADTFRSKQQFFALSTAILLCGSALIRTQKLNFFLEIFSNDIFILSKGSHTYK